MSLILYTASQVLLPILLLFSVFILFRGHQEPGGGFVGGLVASMAFTLYTISNGIKKAKLIFPFRPSVFLMLGLMLSLCSGLFPLLLGRPAFTGVWGGYEFPLIGPINTPLFFDIGVYFVVMGATMSIIFTLKQKQKEK